jgi:hypothetical protein
VQRIASQAIGTQGSEEILLAMKNLVLARRWKEITLL